MFNNLPYCFIDQHLWETASKKTLHRRVARKTLISEVKAEKHWQIDLALYLLNTSLCSPNFVYLPFGAVQVIYSRFIRAFLLETAACCGCIVRERTLGSGKNKTMTQNRIKKLGGVEEKFKVGDNTLWLLTPLSHYTVVWIVNIKNMDQSTFKHIFKYHLSRFYWS